MPTGASHVERFSHGGATLIDEIVEVPASHAHIIFLHGWRGSRDSLRGIAALFQNASSTHLIDLPGFGEAPAPPPDWATPSYADLVQQYILDRVQGRVILVGHSFGGRVALRLGARRLAQIQAMVLMSVPGLPLHGLSWLRVRRGAVRLLRRVFIGTQALSGARLVDWHTRRFGSKDYLAAGELRSIFVRTVTENLTESARAVGCPVLLLWGAEDTETPPWLAERYRQLVGKHATLVMLPHTDHHLYTGTGAHLCAFKIRQWLAGLGPQLVGPSFRSDVSGAHPAGQAGHG